MRYVLVAIFVCAVGMPAASALPTVSPNSLSLSKADPIAQAPPSAPARALIARAAAPAPAASILWSEAAITEARKEAPRGFDRGAPPTP